MNSTKMNDGCREQVLVAPNQLQFGSSKSIPVEAVRLSDIQVMELQSKAIEEWVPQTDMWPLRFGSGICGGLAGLSGILMNNHFRGYLQLMTFGRGSTLLPAVALPSVVAMLCHEDMILRRLVLGKFDCPICVEIRSATIQTVTGFVYPLLMSSVACGLVAKQYNLYRMPPLADVRGLARLFQKIVQRQKPMYVGLLALNVLASFSLTQMEGMSFAKLMSSRRAKIVES